MIFWKSLLSSSFYSCDPYRLELRIKSLLTSVVKSYTRRGIGDKETRERLHDDQVVEDRSQRVHLYDDRPCRSFDFDLLKPSNVELLDAGSDNPDVRHCRLNVLEPDFLY